MNLNILFVIDDLEFKYFEFNKLVTNFWFIKELLSRDCHVDITTKNALYLENAQAKAEIHTSYIKNKDIFYDKEIKNTILNDYDVIFFRPDPPVDTDYINACYIFDFVDRNKVLLINDPNKIIDFNEKLHLDRFYQYAPKNIVTASFNLIKNFVEKYGRAIIKPLNRCFGSGVFYLEKTDKNLNSIINTVTNSGKTIVMVQEYIEEAQKGDKRVLILGNKVYTQTVRKLPGTDDFKFNTHSDKFFAPDILTENEFQIAKDVASRLTQEGLYLVGLDMVGNKILEINVTSPCYFIKEINDIYQINFEDELMHDLLELIENKISESKKQCLV